MAKCRISNLVPACDYNVQGIRSAEIIDLDDFDGFQFEADGLEDTALVELVFASDIVALPVSTGTKYSSTRSGRVYAHTLETFVPRLSGQMSAALDLATRRRFVVLFTTNNGQRFAFGYENGATLSYTNQTADAVGSIITLTAASIYPLFELLDGATSGGPRPIFDVDFTVGASCEIE